jgi:hypothetical protein
MEIVNQVLRAHGLARIPKRKGPAPLADSGALFGMAGANQVPRTSILGMWRRVATWPLKRKPRRSRAEAAASPEGPANAIWHVMAAQGKHYGPPPRRGDDVTPRMAAGQFSVRN